ncbi:uncharacterized protein LODBEIA_P43250 [Lodderomyces beijingensis]|uniref:serine--tRNA ligase n=1 Tax=Lodderomyces beijingensis TaxID=1775926 RepID=A0ABP0ZSM2_9ASCO
MHGSVKSRLTRASLSLARNSSTSSSSEGTIKNSGAKNSSILLRAQLDINDIISRPQIYKDSVTRRHLPLNLISDIDFITQNRPLQASHLATINALKRERKDITANLNNTQEKDGVMSRLKQIKSELQPLEKQLRDLQELIYAKAEDLPNLLDESVPRDSQTDEVVSYINMDPEEAQTISPAGARDHRSIGEELGILDFVTASRVSGSSWYYMLGDGALLEQALVQYALSRARQRDYKMITPPSVVKSEIVQACGFKPQDQNNEKQIYQIEDEPLSLCGTAEIPMGAFHSSTIFPSGTQFPLKYVGVSRSYRAEAGASGKDTRGLYRVHEFTKVELFHFTKPRDAQRELDQIRDFQIDLVRSLGIQARVLNMSSADLGAPAMKKYDIEAWMPGRGSWGEITSSSNCGTYQARRLGTRYHDHQDRVAHVATLNGTCMAVPRVLVALIEQNYDPVANVVRVPSVLWPYMDGKEVIAKN